MSPTRSVPSLRVFFSLLLCAAIVSSIVLAGAEALYAAPDQEAQPSDVARDYAKLEAGNGAALTGASVGLDEQAVIEQTVHVTVWIERSRVADANGDWLVAYETISALGTYLADGRIVTHNHWAHDAAQYGAPWGKVEIQTSTGDTLALSAGEFDDSRSGQTTYISLTGQQAPLHAQLTGLRGAALSDSTAPLESTAVHIAYQDNAGTVLVYHATVKNGALDVNGEQHIVVDMGPINPGDSGGGLFINNEYVANAHSVAHTVPNGSPVATYFLGFQTGWEQPQYNNVALYAAWK